MKHTILIWNYSHWKDTEKERAHKPGITVDNRFSHRVGIEWAFLDSFQLISGELFFIESLIEQPISVCDGKPQPAMSCNWQTYSVGQLSRLTQRMSPNASAARSAISEVGRRCVPLRGWVVPFRPLRVTIKSSSVLYSEPLSVWNPLFHQRKTHRDISLRWIWNTIFLHTNVENVQCSLENFPVRILFWNYLST